jgi:aminopeptidase N
VLAPKEYNISLTLGLELFVSGSERADQFSAAAALSFDVVQPTNCIVLHSRDLVFEDITLTTGDGEVIRICSGGDECKSTVIQTELANPPANSFDADLIVLDLQNTTLEPGSVPIISFAYKGTVGVDPRALGIHRSLPYAVCTSKGTDCEERYLVSSQLEPTGARRVFPSYDGPAHKAVFNIQLTAPAAEAPIVLSNAPEASTSFSEDGSKTTTTFEPTPKMSPYLVAITAGILEEAPVVSTSTGRRRLAQQTPQKVLRAWGVPGRSVLMADALELATAALQYFEEYFGVPQPVIKVSGWRMQTIKASK